jgi:hypothetical protein
VLEITVEGLPGNTIEINLTLIRATSPEQAYSHAIALGQQSEVRDSNLEGKQIVTRFLGLRNLDVIHDALEHGCELLYEEKYNLSPAELDALIRQKDDLNLFRL